MTKPEAVAAPLEPSQLTAEKFYDDVYEGDNACVIWNTPSDKVGEIWRLAEAYAAAVSKNLQQKLDKCDKALAMVTHQYLEMFNSGEDLRTKLLKEITALRETK